MNKIVLTLLLFPFFLVSCSGVDPITWNAGVVESYNSTLEEIDNLENQIELETIGDVSINESMKLHGEQLLASIDKSIQHYSENEVPEGAEAYRDAVVATFEAMKVQVTICLKYAELTKDCSDKNIENFVDDYDRSARETTVKIDSMIVKQKEFSDLVEIDLV